MTPDDGFNCPNCGARLSRALRASKMLVCAHCESTVLLDDSGLRNAGKKGVMAEEPSLLALERRVHYRKQSFLPLGQARFSYGAGWWDEFWALDGAGEGVWISVDEGDIAIEQPYPAPDWLDPGTLRLGRKITIKGEFFRITEAGAAECLALRGEFPEELRVGQRFDYWDLSGPKGRLITLEYEAGEFAATEGAWIDPFEIRMGAAGA